MKKKTIVISACAFLFASILFVTGTEKEQKDPEDKKIMLNEGKIIYLAGGCFWGMEKLFQSLPGVTDAVSGYANGKKDILPDYRSVCTGQTGYRETVRVSYDPKKISLEALLFAYYYVIDPRVKDGQGNDKGSQYQTGIYYDDEDSGETVIRISDIVKKRTDKFYVEIEPLENFHEAEEYHQDYLDMNPGGYCHVNPAEIKEIIKIIDVTQNSATERPFDNLYWKNHEKGIYVDILTGQPLFASTDKYDSSCGWPSFSKPIDENALIEKKDDSLGMSRTEVRSSQGDSHLGHVFTRDSESPTGTRYCINSASLRFIPYENMEKEGYGHLKASVR